MKRILALVLSLSLLVSMMAILSSCASYTDNEDISSYYVGALYDFDPVKNYTNDEAMEVFSLIYEPLFDLKADGSVDGALVKEYKYDAEKNQLTLVLRDTCWNDSTRVTAYDVVYAWQRILACDFENQAAPLLYDIYNAYECKMSALDPLTGRTIGPDDIGLLVDYDDDRILHVTLEEGTDVNGFLRNLTSVAVTALDEDVVSVQPDYWARRTATIQSSGPFTVRTLDFNQDSGGYFFLGRNVYYRMEEGAEISDLTKYVIPALVSTVGLDIDQLSASESKIPGYMKDRLDEKVADFMDGLENTYLETVFFVGDLSLEKRAELKENANIVMKDMMSTYSYVFNMNNPTSQLAAMKDFRVGFSMVIDRAKIAEKAVFGKAATGFVSYGVYDGASAGTSFRTAQDAEGSLIGDAKATQGKNKMKAAVDAALAAYIPLTADEIEYERLVAERDGKEFDRSKYLLVNNSGKPIITLLCHNSEEDAAIAKIVSDAVKSVVELKVVSKTYVYATDEIYLNASVPTNNEAQLATILFDGHAMAWERDENGNMYYYEAKDRARANPMTFDLFAMDYQMLSTDAFASLATFSSAYSGNGIDPAKNYAAKTSTSGWKNDAYDALIASAFAEKDLDKRAEILHEAEELLLSEMPIVPLMFNVNFALVSDRLKDVTVDERGYFDMTRAYIEGYESLPSKLEENAQ